MGGVAVVVDPRGIGAGSDRRRLGEGSKGRYEDDEEYKWTQAAAEEVSCAVQDSLLSEPVDNPTIERVPAVLLRAPGPRGAGSWELRVAPLEEPLAAAPNDPVTITHPRGESLKGWLAWATGPVV